MGQEHQEVGPEAGAGDRLATGAESQVEVSHRRIRDVRAPQSNVMDEVGGGFVERPVQREAVGIERDERRLGGAGGRSVRGDEEDPVGNTSPLQSEPPISSAQTL